MKIQQVKTNFVRLPLEEPLVGAPPLPGMLREFITVQIQTDEGIEGIGITTFGGKIVRMLKSAVEEFAELIKGEDPLRTEQVTGKLRAASAPCGPGGVAALAISAIDIALWDIRGKASAFRSRTYWAAGATACRPMPAARSCEPRRPDKIERAAAALVEKGYGRSKPRWQLTGLPRARDRAHSPHPRCGWSGHHLDGGHQSALGRYEAISIGRRIEELGLGWLEDPTARDDYQGLPRSPML